MENSNLNIYGVPLRSMACSLRSHGFYQLFSENLAINSEVIRDKIKKLSLDVDYSKNWVSPHEFRLFNAMEHLEIEFPFDKVLVNYLAYEMFGADKKIFYNVMANMVNAGEIGSGGGWHRDTRFSKEFKAILYLSDVEKQSGPFEYIECSHNRKRAMLQEIRKRTYLHNRYSEKAIEEYILSTGLSKVSLLGRAGTINVANTVGLHRGSPVKSGERFAVTLYLSKTKIESDLQKDLIWRG